MLESAGFLSVTITATLKALVAAISISLLSAIVPGLGFWEDDLPFRERYNGEGKFPDAFELRLNYGAEPATMSEAYRPTA